MVLHYLNESIALRHSPERLIDRNVRADCGKLRHLMVGRRQAEEERGHLELSGNFNLLRQVIEDGGAMCELEDGFRLRELGERGDLLTMLQCLGLLSHRSTVEGRPHFAAPNQTAKH